MKKLLFLFVIATIVVACEKKEDPQPATQTPTTPPPPPTVYNANYSINIDVSQSALDRDCEVGKVFVCELYNDSVNYFQSKTFSFDTQSWAFLDFDKIQKGNITYDIDIYELYNGQQYYIKSSSDFITNTQIKNNEIPDKNIVLYSQDICD